MRMLLSLAIFASLAISSAHAAPKTYRLDKKHSTLIFFVNHAYLSNKIGFFREFDATLTLDKANPQATKLEVTIDPKSIDMLNKALDTELQGLTWLNSARFPRISYQSTALNFTGKNTVDVTGNLTILGVSKPVVLSVTLSGSGQDAATKEEILAFSGNALFKRSQFGMRLGMPNAGDDIRVIVEAEFRAPPQ